MSVTNDAEWCIAVNLSGTVTFENLQTGDPRHMRQVPGGKSLEWWGALAEGDVATIEQEPWVAGCG